jgi:hypothetical protein
MKLNYSTNNANELSDSKEFEQTPQGKFPKFIRRPSHTSKSELEIPLLKAKEMADQNIQTFIGGLSNKLIISPPNGLVDPFDLETLSQKDSIISGKFSKQH